MAVCERGSQLVVTRGRMGCSGHATVAGGIEQGGVGGDGREVTREAKLMMNNVI